jgi:outer membrane receptor protein involved in Fe transport
MKYFLTSIILCFCISVSARAQQSVATVFGHMHLESPDDAQNLLFGMQEITSGDMTEVAPPDTSGAFEFPQLPFATYDLYLREQDHSIFIKRIVVSSPVPVYIELDSIPSLDSTTVSPNWMRSQANVHTLVTAPLISELPVANTIDGIDAIERNMPGIIPAENCWMHLRGEAPPPEFIIDGIPITSEETRTTMPLLDASFIESADLIRGGLDPEYGSNGILNINTKSGFNATTFGHAEYSIGTLGNSSQEVDLGGRGGNLFSYYGSYGSFSTDRYLDPISGPDPNHTNGSGSDYFGKLDILPSNDLTISLLGYYGATNYQIPNFSTATLQDQDNSIIATTFSTRIDYNLSKMSVLSAMGYTRRQSSSYTSNGISAITDSASRAAAQLSDEYFIGARSENFESGGELSYSTRTDWFGAKNDFNITAQGEIYPLQQYFTFASLNSFVLDSGSNRPFLVDTSATGKRISAYVEDRITTADWTISGGVRYDLYDLLASESGLSPRINLAYRATNQLTLRASYNRMFQQAPLENYLVSSSWQAARITGLAQTPVQPEQSNNFEFGANYAFSRYWCIDASGYYKMLDNMLASFELDNSGLPLPANIKSGTMYGGELELALHNWNHLSGMLTVSSCTSLGIVPSDGSSPYSAGFIIGDLAQSYATESEGNSTFKTEQDEPLAASFLLRYDPGFYFFALSGRYDAGLPFGLTNRLGVSAILLNPHLFDADHIAPHATFNFSAGYNLSHFGLPIMISASVVNIFNVQYLTESDPYLGSSHYGMPRTFLVAGELSP